MKARYFKLIQIILESAIPLMGFYLWSWNLYFILLFYMMDMVADECITVLKGRDVIRVGRAQWSKSAFWFIASGFAMMLTFGIIHFFLYVMNPQMNFQAELVRFWTYKELGLEQGYLLMPLVMFAAYQKYNVEYRRVKAYLKIDMTRLFANQLLSHLMIILFSLILFACSFMIDLGEQFFVLSIVSGIALYKLTFSAKPNR